MGLFTKQQPMITEEPIVPESDRLRVGVIGAGKMGQHHVRLLSANGQVCVKGVSDSDVRRAKELGEKFSVPAFSSQDSFPSDVQAVVIASSTPTHHALAKSFLTKGVHCFVEKPLTEKIEEAEDIIELARQKNLVLQVGHVERFNPAVEEMAKNAQNPLFIDASRLGSYDPRMAHVGVVLDLMIHDIDIVLALVKDKVARLDAVGGSVLSDHEDIVKATLHFSRGCRADISASRVSLKPFRKIRLFQKDAYMSLDYSDKSLKVYRKKRDPVKSLLDVSVQHPRLEKKDALNSELCHFIQCIREGKDPLVSGQHGRDALELALEIRKMLRLHKL